MKTVTIQIGNSDNKLTQERWSEFCKTVSVHAALAGQVHFYGHSPGDARWQNACWVVVLKDDRAVRRLQLNLADIRQMFNQDSIAVTVGATLFI